MSNKATIVVLFLALLLLPGGTPASTRHTATQDDNPHLQHALNLQQEVLLTDHQRDLQTMDICQALLVDSNLKSCSCVQTEALYNITCDNFCQLCLDPVLADVCIQYSFSTIYTWLPVQSRFGPVIGRTVQVQTGKDSSRSVFWVEEKFSNGERTSCEALVNAQICNSCTVSTACSNGLVLDCSNRILFPSFDDCNEVQVEQVALNSVFVGRNPDLFDIQTCGMGIVSSPTRAPLIPTPVIPTPPTPQPTKDLMPPKKPLPIDDDSKDESKLFDKDDRGNLSRHLLGRRRRGSSEK